MTDPAPPGSCSYCGLGWAKHPPGACAAFKARHRRAQRLAAGLARLAFVLGGLALLALLLVILSWPLRAR